MNARKLELIKTLISKMGDPCECPTLSTYYIDSQIKCSHFNEVERMAAHLDRATSINLVEKWANSPLVLKEEVPALWCRTVIE
jgi:hypothetical protein